VKVRQPSVLLAKGELVELLLPCGLGMTKNFKTTEFSLPRGQGIIPWTGYLQNRDSIIMFYYVYLLQSIKDKELYIGFTSNLKKRLKKHNDGLNLSTKNSLPWQLIHYESYKNREDARRRERYLKTSQGSRLLKRMLKEYFYLQRLKH